MHKFTSVKGVRKVARANPDGKKSTQTLAGGFIPPCPVNYTTDEEKAAERTETQEKPIPGFKADYSIDLSGDEAKELERAFAALPSEPIRPIPPEEHIARTYDIKPNCTNVPRLLYAILCEVVRGRK